MSTSLQTRSYTVTDEVVSQRSMAAKTRADKQRLLKAVDAMCTKFRWHLDEKQRLHELAFYITETFDYDAMIQLYEEAHHAALDEYKKKMEEAWQEEKSVLQSQIDELRQMLEHASQQASAAAAAAKGQIKHGNKKTKKDKNNCDKVKNKKEKQDGGKGKQRKAATSPQAPPPKHARPVSKVVAPCKGNVRSVSVSSRSSSTSILQNGDED